MTTFRFPYLLLAVCFTISLTGAAAHGSAAEKRFTHPGILHSRDELDLVKAKVAKGEEPWKSAWEELRSHDISGLDWKPAPAVNVVRGPYNRPDIGGTDLMRDGAAAYSHAIQWYVTGEQPHADKAIEILNAYATTLESIGGHDAKLLAGMAGITFTNAAEILRHTEADWGEPDQKRFEQLLREVFYAVIEDFYPTANGNWDAAMIQTMLAMGVFLDDREMFQRAVDYTLSGNGNGAIRKYFNEFGECQESGRDQAHTQMGLGHDVPYESYRSHEGRYHYPEISDKSRGRFSSIYERVYHHYHNRMGLEMPFTAQVIEKIRPERWRSSHASWGTLMHAGQPAH